MDKGMFTEKIYVARSGEGASFHDNNGTEKEGREEKQGENVSAMKK